jgi:hypothetical protein
MMWIRSGDYDYLFPLSDKTVLTQPGANNFYVYTPPPGGKRETACHQILLRLPASDVFGINNSEGPESYAVVVLDLSP